MLPPKPQESAEIGVRGHHGAAMLDGERRMLGIGDKLPGGAGLAAEPFEYVQVIRAGTHNTRRRAFHE